MEFEDIERVAVLGAGSTGLGVAEVAALAGYEVTVQDVDEEFLEEGYQQVERSLSSLADRELLTHDQVEHALARLSTRVDLPGAVGDADVVFEALPEREAVKTDVLRRAVPHLPEAALFASTTSTVPITALGEATDRPERVCGTHFFDPPISVELVEVVAGDHTGEETLTVVEALARDFGKTPVRVRRDSPGYVVNRVLAALVNEAGWLVADDVGTVQAVDSTTKFDVGLPAGTFELGDRVGYDLLVRVLERLHEEVGAAYEPTPFLAELAEAEHGDDSDDTGVYADRVGDENDQGDVAAPDVPVDAESPALAERLVAVMANEVGALVGGDVADLADVDEAMRLGAGFPDGPATIADDRGLDALVARLEELEAETGHPRYRVSAGLRAAAEAGGFYAAERTTTAGFDHLSLRFPGDGVGEVVLGGGGGADELTSALMEELAAALDRFERDDAVDAVVLTGDGEWLPAGVDVSSLGEQGEIDPLTAIGFARTAQRTFARLAASDLPVVAGIDGPALDAGFQLALFCDLRVASERAAFGTDDGPPLLSGLGGAGRLARVAGEGRAAEIALRGGRFDAEEMHAYGVVNEVVPPDEFRERVHGVAADLAAGPSRARSLTKRAIRAGRADEDAGLELEARAFAHLVAADDVADDSRSDTEGGAESERSPDDPG